MAKQGQERERLLKKLEERRKAKIVEENNKTIFKIDGETQAKSTLSNDEMEKMQMEMDSEHKSQKPTPNKKKGKKKKGKK